MFLIWVGGGATVVWDFARIMSRCFTILRTHVGVITESMHHQPYQYTPSIRVRTEFISQPVSTKQTLPCFGDFDTRSLLYLEIYSEYYRPLPATQPPAARIITKHKSVVYQISNKPWQWRSARAATSYDPHPPLFVPPAPSKLQ